MWTKVTCRNRETFYVVGIAHKRERFDGIYLARREGKELIYAGKVERGFKDKSIADLTKRAEPFKRRLQPFSRKMKKPRATWYEPHVRVDVDYRALTGTGRLRHPMYKGVREDLL